MPWVRFTGKFDFTPAKQRLVTVAYKAGAVENVTRECADTAVAAGRAERTQDPRKAPADEAEPPQEGADAGRPA